MIMRLSAVCGIMGAQLNDPGAVALTTAVCPGSAPSDDTGQDYPMVGHSPAPTPDQIGRWF